MSRCTILSIVASVTVGLSTESASARIQQTDLRRFTEYAIKHNLVTYSTPHLDWTGPSVTLELGGTAQTGDAGSDSYDMPLFWQFRVTLLRKFRNEPQQRDFWTPILRQTEVDIEKMLNTIDDDTMSENRQREIIYDLDAKMTSRIRDAVNALVIKYGKKGIAPPAVAVAAFVVKISTSDPVDSIQYVSAGLWELYKFRKKNGEKDIDPPELTTVDPTGNALLGGKYHFRILWANGIEQIEDRDVVSSTLTFKRRVN